MDLLKNIRLDSNIYNQNKTHSPHCPAVGSSSSGTHGFYEAGIHLFCLYIIEN
ncbi:hypothetical protein HMPREF9418_2588 [Neisseria macacae ATCC 33926]|uniref:Uncharacterized protein n=1 Tax=Neisseria macacae ATCC 33926 TaxID=997348 RepID=A0AA36UH07_9NEIS|nr:hypothetical protein HMPREF9418_2588 [Neisseria macacae ATCC 33926]